MVYPAVKASVGGDSKRFSAARAFLSTDRIVRCKKCGLVYVNPRHSEEEMVDAYAKGMEDGYVSQAQERMNTFKNSLEKVERIAGKKGKILDVGCAAGFFLNVAKAAGWQVYGVEPNKWMASFGNREYGVNIRQGTLRGAKFNRGFFDVVTMWDVLEHTGDPTSELEEALRVLKPGGLLVVNVPNFASSFSRIFKRKWWFVLSNHVYYFTPQTIRGMLEKTGFEVVKSQRYYQSLSLGYLVDMVNHLSKNFALQAAYKAGKLFIKTVGIEKMPVRYYAGQLLVIARKK